MRLNSIRIRKLSTIIIRIAIRKGKGTGSYLDLVAFESSSQVLVFGLREKFVWHDKHLRLVQVRQLDSWEQEVDRQKGSFKTVSLGQISTQMNP
jgi:hypothetical protein